MAKHAYITSHAPTRRALFGGAVALATAAAIPVHVSAQMADEWSELGGFLEMTHPDGGAVIAKIRETQRVGLPGYEYRDLPPVSPCNLIAVNFTAWNRDALVVMFGRPELRDRIVVSASSAYPASGMWVK